MHASAGRLLEEFRCEFERIMGQEEMIGPDLQPPKTVIDCFRWRNTVGLDVGAGGGPGISETTRGEPIQADGIRKGLQSGTTRYSLPEGDGPMSAEKIRNFAASGSEIGCLGKWLS
jgi:hypothetical protein